MKRGWGSKVVSTIVYDVHFYRFPTVGPITKKTDFYLWHHSCSQKVPVEQESSLSMAMGRTIIFLTLFPRNYILWQQHNMNRSCNPYFSLLFLPVEHRSYNEFFKLTYSFWTFVEKCAIFSRQKWTCSTGHWNRL